VYLETAAAAEELDSSPAADGAETAAAKAPAPTPEAKPAAAAVADAPAPEPTELAVATQTPTVNATTDLPAASADAAIGTTDPAIISGCLTFDDGAYRLKDATGTDAPKSRSWKSGFLRKRSATLEVVDAGALGLPNYVGQRVELTGTLIDREVRARSLHRLAESCRK
jgi:hypothetical protein